MKFSDIVDLARAGYSPKDIKELLELTETAPDVKEKQVEDVIKPITEAPKKSEDEIIEDAFARIAKQEE